MPTGLAKLTQEDFAAGIVRATARHLIPANGVYDAVNLLADDDGSLYKRAGSAYKSTAFGAAGLRGIWDTVLGPGQRTVFASPTAFGVLDSDDTTPANLGGAGLTLPARGVEVGGLLFIDGGTIYGGSRKAADYSTGTVSVTNGSKTVTGSGTTWNTLVDAGMLLRVAGSGRYYTVASIDSTTQITLRDAYQGSTAAGQAYVLSRLGSATVAPYAHTGPYAAVAGRLISAEGNRVYFSNTVGSGNGPHVWTATDFHEIPDGSQVLGVEAVRDVLLVFTTAGVWAISGLAYNLFDNASNPQQRLERVNPEFVLWSKESIASWQNALVVAATDGVWLFDNVSAPTRLSNSITPVIAAYVKAGYVCGRAVVQRNHYLLPILDASGGWVDLLVCRLDRQQQSRIGPVFPWTRFDGAGAKQAAFARRVPTGSSRTPLLLGASVATASRVNQLSYFSPTAALKLDADGTAFTWQLTTRDYATGDGNRNLVRRARLRYELVDAAADNPTVQAYYSTGQQGTGSTWGGSTWGTDPWSDSTGVGFVQLAGSAPEDDGRTPYPWLFNGKGRFIRFRFQSSDAAATMAVRDVRAWIRPSQKDD